MKDISFGGLLELKLTFPGRKMLVGLVEGFNPMSRMFILGEGKEFFVTVADVFDVFCLPRNEGNKVMEYVVRKKG